MQLGSAHGDDERKCVTGGGQEARREVTQATTVDMVDYASGDPNEHPSPYTQYAACHCLTHQHVWIDVLRLPFGCRIHSWTSNSPLVQFPFPLLCLTSLGETCSVIVRNTYRCCVRRAQMRTTYTGYLKLPGISPSFNVVRKGAWDT